MNKQEFLNEIEKLSSNFTPEQKELVKKMTDTFAPYEHTYENGQLFVKKIKDKDAENPVNLFSIGVKKRPLTFIRFSLNLDTNEIKKVVSELKERTVALPPSTAPDGSVVHHIPQTFLYSEQAIETL